MTKNVGNYIGFTTDGVAGINVPLSGVWNLFDQSRYARRSTWPATPSGVSATGSVVSNTADGFLYFTFTGPGTLNLETSKTAEVLMAGGGGGGGWYSSSGNGGGGGGAGGLVYVPAMPLPLGAAPYPVTIGAGGLRAPTPAGAQVGSNGSPTTFNGFTALGGGYGGGYFSAGNSGGSGGTGNGGINPGTQPTQPQPLPAPSYFQYGNPSGSGSAPAGNYDGGGGAGEPGSTPTTSFPTPGFGGTYGGGRGIQYPQFTPPNLGLTTMYPAPSAPVQNGYWAGGGAGGGYSNPGGRPWGSGMGGGGGNGNGFDPSIFYHAIANTGGGGAGGANAAYNGNGGSGIVIIRFAL